MVSKSKKMATPAIKTCKCGSTKHKRTNHKECPMNKKRFDMDSDDEEESKGGGVGPTNSAFTAWTVGIVGESVGESDKVMDTAPIHSKKYKTVGEVKSASGRSAIQTIRQLSPSREKSDLEQWYFETYKLANLFRGNLTGRIRNISDMASYNHISRHCLDGINPQLHCNSVSILPIECRTIIKELHEVEPVLCGILMDYLIRRLISESRGEEFTDTKASNYSNLEGVEIINDKPIWQLNQGSESPCPSWCVFDKPNTGTKTISTISINDRFIELERKDEWLKIKYKGVVGWVRYLVPDVEITIGVNGNINDYIPNKWFTKIEDTDDMHYCVGGCKYSMEQLTYNYMPTEINKCVFPICQNVCFMKAKDTIKYDTSDILKELLIVSCCHIEAFEACPSQDKFNKIINMLATIDVENFINPIKSLCNILSNNSKKIIYNPGLGGKSHTEGITLIPADCDLVIDDVLIDIKCTRNWNKNDNLEILQLLGYASLLKYNERYNLRIKNVCILNLLQGKCKVYNIENILDSNLLEYLHLLTNKYDKTKQITIRDVDTTRMSHPLFMNELEAYRQYMGIPVGCPDKKDTVSTTQNGYGWMKTSNNAFNAWTAGEMYDPEWTHDGDDYFGPGPAAMRE